VPRGEQEKKKRPDPPKDFPSRGKGTCYRQLEGTGIERIPKRDGRPFGEKKTLPSPGGRKRDGCQKGGGLKIRRGCLSLARKHLQGRKATTGKRKKVEGLGSSGVNPTSETSCAEKIPKKKTCSKSGKERRKKARWSQGPDHPKKANPAKMFAWGKFSLNEPGGGGRRKTVKPKEKRIKGPKQKRRRVPPPSPPMKVTHYGRKKNV